MASAVGIRVFRTVREVREWRDSVLPERRPRPEDEVEHRGPSEGSPRARVGTVGLVPTMGALHDGHIALARRAAGENDRAVASIFVNPTQFGPNEDFRSYPRSEERDLELLEQAGCAAAFVPSLDEIYPPADDTRIVPGDIASRLEGAARPGHFAGVCTVVAKLFGMVRPTRAYFGQKDLQQLRVIQTMVRDLAMDVRVIPCPTVRAADGLALSSRNAYLSDAERRTALALSRGLHVAEAEWQRGERDARRLREWVTSVLAAAELVPEYVSVADPVTLREIEGPADRAVVSLACRVGRARLIDNALLGMTVEELAAL